MLSAMLLCWGWSFHLLSKLCFCLAEAYICLVESLILKPLGYRPILASKRVRQHSTLRLHPGFFLQCSTICQDRQHLLLDPV
jgi:hypothetical protein